MLLKDMPLRRADYRIVAVSSMEQLIGGALSTVIGVMLPMMQLTLHPELPSWLQGLLGAMGLIGIGLGSLIIGRISDDKGYLLTFRLCPVAIMLGSLICLFFPNLVGLIIGLLTIGIGVGGGYSLDSAYISELLPEKWRLFMVGVAKATCSIGFIGAAVVCALLLHWHPDPKYWNSMILVIFALGLITLLLRVRWAESPKWLLVKGRKAEAQKAAEYFLGNDVQIDTTVEAQPKPVKFSVKDNFSRIIFSGIPWACEGLAVYGFSVFLPVLVMALGIESAHTAGIHKIIDSVWVTAAVNFFILPGFILGLLMMRKVNNVKMLYVGFLFSAVGLVLLLVSFLLKWPVAWMLAGFVIFEIALNAGPHLITFIIPSRIYPVAELGAGNGIAAMIGKVGAVGGVILMPILLDLGGMTLVLGVSAGVMLLGAVVGMVYGKILKLV